MAADSKGGVADRSHNNGALRTSSLSAPGMKKNRKTLVLLGQIKIIIDL
jgi:hypothetical protein